MVGDTKDGKHEQHDGQYLNELKAHLRDEMREENATVRDARHSSALYEAMLVLHHERHGSEWNGGEEGDARYHTRRHVFSEGGVLLPIHWLLNHDRQLEQIFT